MNLQKGTQIDSYTIQDALAVNAPLAFYRVSSANSAHDMVMAHIAGGVNDANRSRLLQDRAALTQLRHPNLARVAEVGSAEADIFVVYERPSGEHLSDLLARQPVLPVGGIVDMLMQLGEGLIAAHRQGMLHGAVSPQAIFVRPGREKDRWRATLTHLGIFQYGQNAFPPELSPYLAPERLQGRAANGRSDVFSLGVLLKQLVAPNGNLGLLAQQRPDIAALIEPVAQKATAVKMTARYRSVEELMHALRQLNSTLSAEQKQFALGEAIALSPRPAMPAPPPPETPVPPDHGNAEQAEAAITIAHPNHPQRTYPLNKWLITVGSSPKNDLVLDEVDVAGRHVRIEQSETGWTVVDLGNASRTEINGTRLLPDVKQVWHPGQILQVGSFALRWQPVQPVAAVSQQMLRMSAKSLHLHLKPANAQVKPGQFTSYILDITNETQAWHQIKLSVNGIPSEWIFMEASPIQIPPERSVLVPLTIQPPKHSSAKLGQHPFEVMAAVNGQQAQRYHCSGKVDVLPFQNVETMMQQSPLKHNEAGQLTVKNFGNVSTTCELRVEDPANEVTFTLDEKPITMQAGEEKVVEVTAVSAKRPIFLQSKLTSYNVRVRYGNARKTEQHQLLVTPRISWLILGLITIPLLLAVILSGRAYLCQSTEYPFCPTTSEEVDTDSSAATANVEAAGTVEATPTADNAPEPAPTITVEHGGTVIGTSTNGESIYMHQFGDGEHAILFIGGIHAGYAPSSVTLADGMVAHYAANSSNIPANVSLYIIPNMNPDSVSAPGQRDGRFNANNVDLNRNWPCGWQADVEILNIVEPSGGGTEPISAKESQVVNEQIQAIMPTAVIILDAIGGRNLVSPGQCGTSHQPSESLSQLYAAAVQFTASQAGTPAGDISDSLAGQGIASVFVLLNDFSQADVQTHLPGVQAVMDRVSETGGFE
ncbi:MAG: FHA domain-containing protein [Anaerolineales bacterium]|nr:FHA domain-containing protein [Anaerolineales bacterium]